jgi:hypothetical protein
MFYLTLRKRKLSPGNCWKNLGDIRAIARNIGLCPVRPADMLSAARIRLSARRRGEHEQSKKAC